MRQESQNDARKTRQIVLISLPTPASPFFSFSPFVFHPFIVLFKYLRGEIFLFFC